VTERLIQSVPTDEVERYFHCGWIYLMPDFDKPNYSKVEWVSQKLPVYPLSSKKPQTEDTNVRAINRHQRPA
jgi:hypothetical protein